MDRKKSGKSELHIYESFLQFPLSAHQPRDYEQFMEQANQLIGARDSDDVPVLALALTLNAPIWSNDSDFQGLPGVVVYTTAELLQQV